MAKYKRLAVAAVISLALITAAACGDDDDYTPSSSPDTVEEFEPTDAELDAQREQDRYDRINEDLTGHVVTFPDGSTAHCVVLSWDPPNLECNF